MAPLSDLSIGFIVGGSVVTAAIITGLVIWKVIENKRNAKPTSTIRHEEASSAHNRVSNNEVGNHGNIREICRSQSVYSEIIYSRENDSVTIIDDNLYSAADDNLYSAAEDNINSAADDNLYSVADDNLYSVVGKKKCNLSTKSTVDSGYSDNQSICKESETYSRLHDIKFQMENVYGQLSRKVEDQSSHFDMTSESSNSITHHEADYMEGTPTFQKHANQQEQDYFDTTPKTEVLDGSYESDYCVPELHCQIIEIDQEAFRQSRIAGHEHDDAEIDDQTYSECVLHSKSSSLDTRL